MWLEGFKAGTYARFHQNNLSIKQYMTVSMFFAHNEAILLFYYRVYSNINNI